MNAWIRGRLKVTRPENLNRPARFFAVLLCALLTAASANAQDYGDVSVKVETVTEARSPSGYDEYRVTIINRSLAKSHRVKVAAHLGSFPDHVIDISRAVESASSSAATISMFKPRSGSADWSVIIDGERQRDAV